MTQLHDLLNAYRSTAKSQAEKGAYFERLVRVFLRNDGIQKQHYTEVLPWTEWVDRRPDPGQWNRQDTGIDLVATLADGSGYAAVQCKFHAARITESRRPT